MSRIRPRLASRPEVAEYLQVAIGTLEKWAHHGEGPKYVRVGRHTRYAWQDVDDWLAAQKRGGRSGSPRIHLPDTAAS